MNHQIKYHLKREADGSPLFEAAVVKHYEEGYSALFESFMTSNTNGLLCRRLDSIDRSYGNNLAALYKSGNDTPICYLICLSKVNSDAEAKQMAKSEQAGNAYYMSLVPSED